MSFSEQLDNLNGFFKVLNIQRDKDIDYGPCVGIDVEVEDHHGMFWVYTKTEEEAKQLAEALKSVELVQVYHEGRIGED
jgi:hypothetical protein